jgi:hypothetical protein
MKYRFNEGVFQVPEYLDDRTVNVLAPKLGSAGLTVAVTRDPMEGEESLQQFVDRQLADLAKQVSKYQKGNQEPAQLGQGRSRIEGVKFSVNYKQSGKLVHHVQAAFVLPSTRKVLCVTFSSPVAFTAEHLNTVNSVLASFEQHTA